MTHVLVVPLAGQSGPVGQQVDVPVESFKVTDKVVVDVAGSAGFVVGRPVLVVIPQVPVRQVGQELRKPVTPKFALQSENFASQMNLSVNSVL